MSVFFKSRGNYSFGVFLIRVSIGFMFFIAGMKKAGNVEGFINHVKSMNILNENLSFIFGFILPFAEIFFGILYIIGFLTPITSFFLSLMLISIISATGFIPPSGPPFAWQLVLLACTIMTMFSGAGSISFDVFLDRKKRRIITVSENKTEVKSNLETKVEDVKNDNIKDANFESIDENK